MIHEKTCCVTGHRDIPEERTDVIREYLYYEVISAIEDGYTRFISGFAAGADLLFAEIVVELKEVCPIMLEAAIPHPGRMKTPDRACCKIGQRKKDRQGSPKRVALPAFLL